MSEINNNIKILSRVIGRHKHILINDAGIGSNRIKMSNNYLNTFNYFHKNMIKMNRIKEIKAFERKQQSERFKTEKEIPRLMFSSGYYKYTGNDYEFFENDKSNVVFKKAKINYLQDLLNNNENKINNINDINNKDKHMYKSLKLSGKLMLDENNTKNENKYRNICNKSIKSKIYKYNQDNKSYENNDDFIYSKTNRNINYFKNKSIKCKIIFGKNLHDDLEYKNKEKNKVRYLSYNKNRYETLNMNHHSNKFEKNELDTKSIKMKLLSKNKLLPLIK